MTPPQPPHEAVRRSSFASACTDDVADFLAGQYAENSARFTAPGRRASFSAVTADADGLGGVDRVRSSLDYAGRSEEGFRDCVVVVVHGGSIEVAGHGVSASATTGDVLMYPMGVPVDFDVRGCDVTALRLPARTVRQVAEGRTGVPGEQLRFHGHEPVSPAMRRHWRAVTSLVCGAVTDPGAPLASSLLAHDLALTAATAALHVFPNSTTTQEHPRGPGACAPATVRRAVAYLDAHADRPVGVADAAAAAGTGVRALQHGFRRHLGTTPTAYLRRVRLERARRELRDAGPASGLAVAAVAARWGFLTHSSFTAAYRTAYGETPSATLRG